VWGAAGTQTADSVEVQQVHRLLTRCGVQQVHRLLIR